MYGGIYNRRAPLNSAMLPFPRVLRRKFGILVQAALLFLAAVTIIAGFRRFSSQPAIAFDNKLNHEQSSSYKVYTKSFISAPNRLPAWSPSNQKSLHETNIPKSSLVSETTSSKPNIVYSSASSITRFTHKTTSSESSAVLETASPKSTAVLRTVSPISSLVLETAIPKSTANLETPTMKPSPIPKKLLTQLNLITNDVNKTLIERASVYVKAIMTPEDNHFTRLACPPPNGTRYGHLRHTDSTRDLKYFFALDLHRRAKMLPRIVGSIVETIRFLGPEKCALSIVRGSWDDGTSIILKALQGELEKIGVAYFVNSSDIAQGVGEPLAMRRSLKLESLVRNPDRFSTDVTMNMALEPLTKFPERYSTNATVIFLNDVSICMEDILELIHQRVYQEADMTCPMDWTFDQGLDIEPNFHDVWVTRGMTGDSLVNVSIVKGTWEYSSHLLSNDPNAQKRFYSQAPFQVFSCWSGAAVFTAKPLLEQTIKFRTPTLGECVQGESQLFCKDMWYLGYGKVASVPSVSIEYSNEAAEKLKALKGYVSHWVNPDGEDDNDRSTRIEWKRDPPSRIKCYQGPWTNQTWVAWDEYLPEAAIVNGARRIVENHNRGPVRPTSEEGLSAGKVRQQVEEA